MNYAAIHFSKDPVAERSWQQDLEIIASRRQRRITAWEYRLEYLNYEIDPYYQEEPPKPTQPPIVWMSIDQYQWHLQCKEMDEYQRQYDCCGTY